MRTILRFLFEFAKTLIIDTVISAILSPYRITMENSQSIGGRYVCL